MDDPFSVALRVSLETSDGGMDELTGATWRDRLTYIASREVGSRIWRDDTRPHRADADRVVGETFADHPMVNVGDRAAGGIVRRERQGRGPHAFVIAEVVLRPELAPVPPGGRFPDVTDEVLSDPHVVHLAPWPYAPGSERGRVGVDDLLQQVIGALPAHLWQQDG